jgi:hypothetical protein
MKEIDVSALVLAIEEIEYVRKNADELADANAANLFEQKELDKQAKEMGKQHLGVILGICEKLGLRDAQSTAQRALEWFRVASNASPEAARIHLQHVQDALVEQLDDIRFFGLAKDRVDYYANVALFGEKTVETFPSAKSDMTEALRCLALEVNTASVFHLMRVAEIGLRALAKDRRVSVAKAPIELATWEQIIRELEESEEKIHNYPKTLAREEQYQFYHGALMEIRRFKNVWRNNIMHARDEYDRNQALSIFNHVRDFMSILASRISERSKPLPEIWT